MVNRVTAGKVPGEVKELVVRDGATVLEVMQIAARECNFSFSQEAYTVGDKEKIDVPFINGVEMAVREDGKIVSVNWDAQVSNGDTVLLIPKIKGNQFVVRIGRLDGAMKPYALRDSDDEEGKPGDGTVANALEVADIELEEDECVEVNSTVVETTHVLKDGDIVIVREREEGDAVPKEGQAEQEEPGKVVFGKIDERLEPVEIPARRLTLERFLNRHDAYPNAGERVIHNGEVADRMDFSNIQVEDGDSVLIVPVVIKIELDLG